MAWERLEFISASAILRNEIGLHARPSVKLTRLARGFDAQIELSLDPDGPWHDAKSIIKMLRIKALSGTKLYFRASGRNADKALNSMLDLVESDFGERQDDDG